MTLVKPRSRTLREIEIRDGKTLNEFLKLYIGKLPYNYSVHRLRLTYLKGEKHIPVTEETFAGVLESESTLYVKDLGPQISWRLVFMVEYLGPILIHTALYYASLTGSVPYVGDVLSRVWDIAREIPSVRAALILGGDLWQPITEAVYPRITGPVHPNRSLLLYKLVLFHYLKREFETVFVHRFSNATMPLFNLFKNSFHYWVLNGLIGLSYFGIGNLELFAPIQYERYILLAFFFSEFWNFYTHVRLRVMGGAKVRQTPHGGIFELFVAPNYAFEVYSWLFFMLLTGCNFFSIVFLLVSTVQMYLWAMKKNKKYGTKRAFLIPFVF